MNSSPKILDISNKTLIIKNYNEVKKIFNKLITDYKDDMMKDLNFEIFYDLINSYYLKIFKYDIGDENIIVPILGNIYPVFITYQVILENSSHELIIKINNFLRRIISITKKYHDYNESIRLNLSGGNSLKKTNKCITFIYKNKPYKRNIYLNNNKKKFVKVNNKVLELSKLKIVNK